MSELPENSAAKKKVHCPCCGVLSVWDAQNKYRPFCSERCKLIDLGQWANESYRVAGKPLADESVNQLPDHGKLTD